MYNSTATSSTTTATTTTNTIATTTATATNTDVSNSKNNDDDDSKNNTNSNTSLSLLYNREKYFTGYNKIGYDNNSIDDDNITPSVSNKQSHSINHLHSEAHIFDNISKNNKTKVPIDTHLNIKCLIKTKASSSSFSRPSSSSQPSSSSSSSLSNDSYNMITTIQIKWIDQSTIIAKMYSYETIGDLKSYIIQHFTSLSLSSTVSPPSSSTVAADKASNHLEFEIRSAYPSKVLG